MAAYHPASIDARQNRAWNDAAAGTVLAVLSVLIHKGCPIQLRGELGLRCLALVILSNQTGGAGANPEGAIMARQVINIAGVPKSPYFSHAVKSGSSIYVSGIVGMDPKTNQLAGQTIQEQTRQSITNCRSILEAAGATLDDVVEVQVLLTNPIDFAGMNEEYVKHFPNDPPARSTCKLGVDVPGLLVSIKMTASL